MSYRTLAGFWLISLQLIVTPFAFGADAANLIDKVTLHPAVPLVDEEGVHVLQSGKPYSPRNSCGIGSGGCHDYEGISHGDHFERGRDEADDAFGSRRGRWSQLSSPGYLGGFNCMGPAFLAKKSATAVDGWVGDWGVAGMVKDCASCHTGGGWSEKDRDGIRFDLKADSKIANLDGDYFNRGTDANNDVAADPDSIARWDWKKSGVLENDCLMCHADYTQLKIFPGSNVGKVSTTDWYANDLKETPSAPFGAWWSTRNSGLIGQGLFREGATALLEFLNLKPDSADGLNLVSFERTVGSDGSASLSLGTDGKPIVHWRAEAFDGAGKVVIPMRKFPANDNCWQCHGWWLEQDRRGFFGFGTDAKPTLGANGLLVDDPKDDVHKGKTFTENNEEARVLDNCSGCHTQGIYYRPEYSNVSLDASHDFPKGNSDIDMRRDLDYRPGAKSCEYCHDEAKHKANPSGQASLLETHKVRWTHDGFMTGYPSDSLTKVTQVHLDVVGCQTCHINNLKTYDGKTDMAVFYRYRRSPDGKLKVVPYNATYQFRYFWRDKVSGRVLAMHELEQVFDHTKDAGGNVTKLAIKDADGKAYELSGGDYGPVGAYAFYGWGPKFKPEEVYPGIKALKAAYDKLLEAKGYASPNVQMVWLESNEYLVSHNTRPSVAAVPCIDCHDKKQNGSYSSALTEKGLFGSKNIKVMTDQVDQRLVDEKVMVLDQPYYKIGTDQKLTVSMADVLYASKIDPSMTALNADTATLGGGQWAAASLDQALAFMGVSDDGDKTLLGEKLGGGGIYSFNLPTASAALKGLALAAPASSGNNAGFKQDRIEAEVEPMTAFKRETLAASGLGVSQSDLYSIRLTDQNRATVSDFNGQSALVKLPYRGAACAPSAVRVAQMQAGSWRNTGIVPLVVKPQKAGVAGYAVFELQEPKDSLTLSDPGPDYKPKAALRLAKQVERRAATRKSSAERRLKLAMNRLGKAESALTAAADALAAAQEAYDSATDAAKPKLRRKLDRAAIRKEKAEFKRDRLASKAAQAQQASDAAARTWEDASAALEAANC
ncbi:MAG: cytochrome C [Methylococcaceae bacterium]|nr:cytochrome C [Desulfuromonas sp.]NJD07030.1 cytochrome C [Methylococcaceae bacterium]